MERRRLGAVLAGLLVVGGAVAVLRTAGGTTSAPGQPPALPTSLRPYAAAGVDTGVSPPRNGDPDLAAHQKFDRFLKHALYGPQSRLHGPPAERAAVVRKIKPDTQKPAAP